jgi:hypothetical protein
MGAFRLYRPTLATHSHFLARSTSHIENRRPSRGDHRTWPLATTTSKQLHLCKHYTTMPGILNRDAYLVYRRRSYSITSSASSKSSGSSWASSWGLLWDSQTPQISLTSMASNSTSPVMIKRGEPRLPFVGESRRIYQGDENHHQQRYKESRDDHDSWGQFIDTADAEDEMIRHSKILSKRYAMQ